MVDSKSFLQRATIPIPDLTVEGLYATAMALKEAVDVFMGQRGVPEESVVFKRDLILTGVLTNPVYPFTVPPRDNYPAALSFGGLDTGIAYATDFPYGRWLRLGSLVFFAAGMVLTAKGSAVGPAAISLPYMSRPTPNGHWFAACRQYGTTSPTAAAYGIIEPGSNYAMIVAGGGSTPYTPLLDSHFTATSEVHITGFYEAYVETTEPETTLRGVSDR
jgi:hypothetical protein